MQREMVGLLSGHVVKPRYAAKKVAEALTPRAQVQTINKKELGKDPIARADKFFTEHLGIHKLLVVDDKDHCTGCSRLSDVERITQERKAQFKPARDSHFRLRLRRGGFAPRAMRSANSTVNGSSLTSAGWSNAAWMSSPFPPRTATAKASATR